MSHTIKQFYNAVDVLVRAYLTDTLTAGSCESCAVGNLVANSCGYTISRPRNEHGVPDRNGVWIDSSGSRIPNNRLGAWFPVLRNNCDSEKDHQAGMNQLHSTGYSARELYDIEAAFENRHNRRYRPDLKDRMMLVIDVLGRIHKISTTEMLKITECINNRIDNT